MPWKIAYEVPLRPTPIIQSMTIHKKTFQIRTQYRDADEAGWVIDFHDITEDPNLVLFEGAPLVTGLDLLYQYKYLGFDFAMIMLCQKGRSTPTFESLGIEDKLVIVTTVTDSELLLYGFGADPVKPIGWFWPVPTLVPFSKPWVVYDDKWNDQGQWYDNSYWGIGQGRH